MPSFVALDVETANPDFSSICQIGLVAFERGEVSREWTTLVDPCDYFDRTNVAVHGITPDDVVGAPRFPDLVGELSTWLNGQVVVTHTSFDRAAFAQVQAKHGIPDFCCTWLDSAKVVRRCWPEHFRSRGYGLKNVAEWCGIEFVHHDAREDARAAGQILVRAVTDSGLSVTDWVARSAKPVAGSYSSRVAHAGNPDGNLAGEVVVFTGFLSIPRREAAEKAASCGCDVVDRMTKQVTLVVVGDQDVAKLNGHQKSSKHRRAEDLIRAGMLIRIVGESDFFAMLNIE